MFLGFSSALEVHIFFVNSTIYGCCSLRMYNNLVERCFKDCIDGFRRKDLDSAEEKVNLRKDLNG